MPADLHQALQPHNSLLLALLGKREEDSETLIDQFPEDWLVQRGLPSNLMTPSSPLPVSPTLLARLGVNHQLVADTPANSQPASGQTLGQVDLTHHGTV